MSRASPRYPVRLAATVLVDKARGSGDDMLICRTRNVSREGCLLDTSHEVEPGVAIEITIMDDQTGDAIAMAGWVARSIDAKPGVRSSGVGVRIPDPPESWLALVERQASRRPPRTDEIRAKRQSVVVVGDEERRRGALALYVMSGWDVRFATDFASAREALSSGEIDALVAEHELSDERWPPLLELARELQPRAKRLVRARRVEGKPLETEFRDGLVHRVIDYDAGLDELFAALTAPFEPRPERDANSLGVRLMGLSGASEAHVSTAPEVSTAALLAEDEAAGLLARVIRRAKAAAPEGIIAFDLDSTLLDNRPRQAKIMREYGRAHDIPELLRCTPEHWQGWDFRLAMANARLGDAQIREHEVSYRTFWLERFFTSDYCVVDRPIRGATAYATAAAATGARVVYVTGRPERMRAGTLETFDIAGFPEPDGDRVRLVMKPSPDETDDAYKTRIHDELRALGEVIAAFDNEPAHINGYRESFPEAICIHLATDHSPRPIRVAEGIPSIRDFAAYAEETSP